LIGVPVGVILLAMLFGYFLPSLRRRRYLNTPIAIAPFGRDQQAAIPPRPVRVESAAAPQETRRSAPPVAQQVEQVPWERATASMDAIPAEARAARVHEAELEDSRRVLKLQVAGDPRRDVVRDAPGVSGQTLRLERAAEGTLQFMPGKLEIIEGRDMGQELRFVRTPGPEGQTITFGRNEGAQYRHVQLREHTVSRLHAKMALEGKTWTLTNMSKTNPVTVNGLALGEDNPSVVLRDGDRIEMGEVVFRFRSR
jgi:hypothetical protein